ncbi:UbiA prenyltransferase family protein [Lacinutrix venerupis]|uniref:Prenyltransferase n=1 Tax=Lacinutrix venerupis TaxID=1486034 RepID=A0AAC9LIT9_9FLAO|nr:hypothetical protein [Lacinutrix venerupis]APX99385.1 hypothetical protein BWR22_03355 [Lacinutrix venerupis]
MRILKQFFDFYLNSSIHVALAVCSLSWIVLIKHDVFYNEKVLLFTFFATITGYNFVKYFGIAKFHHRSLTNALKVIQIFSFFCFLLLCYYALQLQIKTLIFIVVFGIITFLYAIPFIPKKMYLDHQQNLRDVSGLKVYVIALVWAGVTVFLPLIEANISFNADVYFLAFQHFIFVIVLMLPFEIRDLKFDSLKLATIPQKIGVKQTKIIGLVLLIIFFFTEFFKDELSQNEIISTLLVAVITAFFLILTNKKKSYYYSSFWVESIPIIWLLIIMLH